MELKSCFSQQTIFIDRVTRCLTGIALALFDANAATAAMFCCLRKLGE